MYEYSLEDDNYQQQLVSLRRNASEWLEVQRILVPHSYYIVSEETDNIINELACAPLCDSRVLLGNGGNTLYVFDVNEAHTLSDAGNVTLGSEFWGVACTRRGNDTLVAFSHRSTVSLHRLASLPLRLETLASVNLIDPWHLLFRGDLLLVADWNWEIKTNAIVSFRAADNALTERRVLLGAQTGVHVRVWDLAGERLVLVTPNEFLVYDFTSNGV